jgi:hypothetical protein
LPRSRARTANRAVTYPRQPAQGPELFRLRRPATTPERSVRARQTIMVLVLAGAEISTARVPGGHPGSASYWPQHRNLRHNAPDRDPVEHAEGLMHGDGL